MMMRWQRNVSIRRSIFADDVERGTTKYHTQMHKYADKNGRSINQSKVSLCVREETIEAVYWSLPYYSNSKALSSENIFSLIATSFLKEVEIDYLSITFEFLMTTVFFFSNTCLLFSAIVQESPNKSDYCKGLPKPFTLFLPALLLAFGSFYLLLTLGAKN